MVAATQSSLDQARQQWPSYRVVCCGHSLGGGIASLVAALLRKGDGHSSSSSTTSTTSDGHGGGSVSGDRWRSGITSIAIGPLACVTTDLATDLDFGDFGTSVVLGMDPAPRLSVANVDRLLQDLNDATVVAHTARAAGSAMSAALGFASLFHRNSSSEATTVGVTIRAQQNEQGGNRITNVNEDEKSADQNEVTAAAAVAIDGYACGVAVAVHDSDDNNKFEGVGSCVQAITSDDAATKDTEADHDNLPEEFHQAQQAEVQELKASKEGGSNEVGADASSKEAAHDGGSASAAAKEEEPASSSSSSEHDASTERVMVPPGRLLHVDDEVSSALFLAKVTPYLNLINFPLISLPLLRCAGR